MANLENPTWNLPQSENLNLENSDLRFEQIKSTIPMRGTEFLIRRPNNWNGVLLADLDYIIKSDSSLSKKLLEMGYAMCGLKRRPERMTNYDPAHEIHDMLSVFDIFEYYFEKPKKTIEYGCSGGGTISIAMSEIHPDRIDGAVAAGASTSPWMANTHLDGLFALKALIAPELPVAGLPVAGEEIEKIGRDWQAAVRKAIESDAGIARIAMAMAIGQWPAWGAFADIPYPRSSAEDIDSFARGAYESMLLLLPSENAFGTTMLELSGRGQLKFNDNVDYFEFYENADAEFRMVVEKLYERAGLSVKEDIEKINATKRIKADACALKYWAKPGRTHVGEPKVPLLRIHTTGDGLVYPAMVQGYEALVREKGYSEMFRCAYSDKWGHCTFSDAEWIASILLLEERIDSGVWADVSPSAMNRRVVAIDSGDKGSFCDYVGVKKYNRTWKPTVKDFLGK